MQETIKEIGDRVRELREHSQFTAEEMAEAIKVPIETYRCYEEGKLDIPASKMVEIGQKLVVDMGLLLTGEEPRMRIFTVTRSDEGTEVERRKDYRYQSLAENFIHKKAEPFIVTIKPRQDKTSVQRPPGHEFSIYSHPGQEFEYVLEGTLKIHIHDHEIVLNVGDSIFFDSTYRHSMEALNDKPVKILAVVM
jgi:mannose-6-phosphate isomerase-like protein (cupin superfamily)/DNA-binding XRE family transcriptional regulator